MTGEEGKAGELLGERGAVSSPAPDDNTAPGTHVRGPGVWRRFVVNPVMAVLGFLFLMHVHEHRLHAVSYPGVGIVQAFNGPLLVTYVCYRCPCDRPGSIRIETKAGRWTLATLRGEPEPEPVPPVS